MSYKGYAKICHEKCNGFTFWIVQIPIYYIFGQLGAAEAGNRGGFSPSTFFARIRLDLVLQMYNYILHILKILNTSSLSKIGYKL